MSVEIETAEQQGREGWEDTATRPLPSKPKSNDRPKQKLSD